MAARSSTLTHGDMWFGHLAPEEVTPGGIAKAMLVEDGVAEVTEANFPGMVEWFATHCDEHVAAVVRQVTFRTLKRAAARESREAARHALRWSQPRRAEVFEDKAREYELACRTTDVPPAAIWTGTSDHRPLRSSRTARRAHRSKAPPTGSPDDPSGDPDPDALHFGVERHLIGRIIAHLRGVIR